jgi:hypothetical protein
MSFHYKGWDSGLDGESPLPLSFYREEAKVHRWKWLTLFKVN